MKLDAGSILLVVFLPGLIYLGNPASALLIGIALILLFIASSIFGSTIQLPEIHYVP